MVITGWDSGATLLKSEIAQTEYEGFIISQEERRALGRPVEGLGMSGVRELGLNGRKAMKYYPDSATIFLTITSFFSFTVF